MWTESELNWVNIDNLKRLALLEVKKELMIFEPEHDEAQHDVFDGGDEEYKLTSLGKDFIKACQLN